MGRTLLVVPTGHGVGLTATCLGLVVGLERLGTVVGYCKPVSQRTPSGAADDHSTDLIRLVTSLDPPQPLEADHVEKLLSAGSMDDVLEEVVAGVEEMVSSCGVTVVQGLTPGPGILYSTRLNAAIARALDADVLLVGTAPGPTEALDLDRLAETMALTSNAYRVGESLRVIGCVVNRLPDTSAETVRNVSAALDERGLHLVGTTAYEPNLSWPRVRDLARELESEILHEGDLDRRIAEVVVCAQNVPGVIDFMRENCLVIVPGDRHDVIMAACLTALNGTRLAGILLTGGIPPDERIWQLTEAARTAQLPVLLTPAHTYRTATATHNLNPEVPYDDKDRAWAVASVVADGLDRKWVEDISSTEAPEHNRVSPAAFRYRLASLAQGANKRIVLPEGTEPRTVVAAAECARRGLAQCVLLGDASEIEEVARRQHVTLGTGIEIVSPDSVAGRYVDRLVELRGHKGMTPAIASNQLTDPIMLGTMMLEGGEVDGLVSGAVHTTAHTIRPALQIVRTAPEVKLVSSLFFMLLPDDVVIYADCAINPDPDSEQLADIALQTATTARAFGIDPKVAMISFSTGESGAGTDVEKVARATAIARERDPSLIIDGPLQYDAAAVASVAVSKRPGSAVAGQANVFIFPDLNTGNTTYKAVQRSADVVSIGPVLQGLGKPVNDLSRGATVEDIVFTVAVTSIQATA